MTRLAFHRLLLASALTLTVGFASAAPILGGDQRPPATDWVFKIGGGLLYAPSFLGSKNYRLLAAPTVSVTYKDSFFASGQEGIGYNIVNSNGWRFGPVVKMNGGRKENSYSPLAIAGNKTNALKGLGDISSGADLGGFVEYKTSNLTTKLEARQAVGADKGAVGRLSVTYARDLHTALYEQGPPLILAIGPHLSAADHTFNQSYFGVTATQAAKSGLSRYTPQAGLLAYGVNGTLIYPLNQTLTLTGLAGYDRLTGDAGNAPLVTKRGSRDQAVIGAFLTYQWGYTP